MIDRFQSSADQQQAALTTAKESPPPLGEVSGEQKRMILSRGPLNDVATCLFINGEVAEKTGRKSDAAKAYEEATRYTYARTYDPTRAKLARKKHLQFYLQRFHAIV